MAYIKWDSERLAAQADEIADAKTRLAAAADELSATVGRLDPQIAGYEGIGRLLRAACEGAREDAARLRRESGCLEEAAAIYGYADRAARRASEELPSSIAERSLIFEDWFAQLL
jgi:hypothetical protein